MLLSGYHSGLERGIFPPMKCSTHAKNLEDISVEEAKQVIYDAPIADCSKPAIKILGLSLTEWNLFLNFVLLAFLSLF